MIFIPNNYVFIVGGNDRKTFYFNIENAEVCEWADLNKIRNEPALQRIKIAAAVFTAAAFIKCLLDVKCFEELLNECKNSGSLKLTEKSSNVLRKFNCKSTDRSKIHNSNLLN